MLLHDKQIAIVGGGPGGLLLARLLQLKDANVKVYERDADKNARVQGSPLDLHDESGLAAITKADLLDVFKQNFMPGADREKIMNPQAEVFFSDHTGKSEGDFGQAHFRPEIDRGVLRKILLESLQPETVIWGSHFLKMEKQGSGWLLHFKSGNTSYADLVIAADGANSKIRSYVPNIKPFYTGILMLEGNIPDAKHAAPNIVTMLSGGKIMAFGDNKNILMGQKGNGEIGFYASFRTGENWALESGLNFSDKQQMLEWFRQQYAEWSPVWNELFEGAATPFIPRPIYCAPIDQTWETQLNIALLGDAAHVMPPFAGKGVNMAMLDALQLSEAIAGSQYKDLQQAIASYETSMRERAAAAAAESLENGEKMHSKDALAHMLAFFGGQQNVIV